MNYRSLALAALCAVLPASATTITFNLASPSGDVGSYTQTYSSTPAGYTITAYGFSNGQHNDLYGKTSGGDETGLGLTGTSDFEIGPNAIVVLDISQLAAFQSLDLEIGSVQAGEAYNILGGNAINNMNAQLITGGTLDHVLFSVPNFSSYKYIGVTAPSGDVLINGLSATSTVPEPATLGIAAAVLGGIFFLRRRRIA